MSGCGGFCTCGDDCACGDDCSCGSGGGCSMFPVSAEKTTTTTEPSVVVTAPEKGSSEGVVDMGTSGSENGCTCNPCKCDPCTCK